MTVPRAFPRPRSNWTAAGVFDRIDAIAAADIIVAAGDFTAGAAEDMFTLTAHGLVSGNILHVLWQSAMGGVTGGEGVRAVVKRLGDDTFQLTTDGSTIIENTADATVVFLKGDIATAVVELMVIPNLIVDAWDFTGGSPEDKGTPAQGMKGLYEADAMKLLYKSAAGVAGVAVDTTVYCKDPTVTYHQIAATAGGSVIDSTADGTAVFLKIS